MLPESQLDRFMVRLTIGYPDLKSEIDMLKQRQNTNPLDQVVRVACKEDIIKMQSMVENVFVHDSIYEYITLLLNRRE